MVMNIYIYGESRAKLSKSLKKELKGDGMVNGDRVIVTSQQKQIFGEKLENGGDIYSNLIKGNFKSLLIEIDYPNLYNSLKFLNKVETLPLKSKRNTLGVIFLNATT